MIWYGPSRQYRQANREQPQPEPRRLPPPRPSPPTALSRRAEADPSTPNPVWVTPRIGGPHTTFTISFRLLISGAVYQYRSRDPVDPAAMARPRRRAGGGIGGGPDDVRGQIWSEPFQPSSGAGPSVTAWCPGTFHVSVSAFLPGRSEHSTRRSEPSRSLSSARQPGVGRYHKTTRTRPNCLCPRALRARRHSQFGRMGRLTLIGPRRTTVALDRHSVGDLISRVLADDIPTEYNRV